MCPVAAPALGDGAKHHFSFIVPTLNEEGYIGLSLAALRATADKSAFKIEIVVVDGASTDRTVDEARPYADVLVIEDDRSARGIAHARNRGAAASHGEFLFHTDADVFVPETEEFLWRLIEAFKDPSVVAAEAAVMPYPWDSTRVDWIVHVVANAFFRSSLWYGALFSRGECQVVRRTAFEKVDGYQGRFVSGEDCDLFRRLRKVGKIRYLAGTCVHHSVRRFRQMGYWRVLGIYLREWVWMNLFDRSYVAEWKVVR